MTLKGGVTGDSMFVEMSLMLYMYARGLAGFSERKANNTAKRNAYTPRLDKKLSATQPKLLIIFRCMCILEALA